MEIQNDYYHSFKIRLLKNSIYSFINKSIYYLIFLFLTPFIVKKLGNEIFGIWTIISVFLGYIGLFDLGIGTSYLKYISEYYTKKNYINLISLIIISIIFYGILSLLVLSITLIFNDQILLLLKIKSNLINEVKLPFIIAISNFCFANIFGIIISIPNGIQRTDISAKINIISLLLLTIGTIIALNLKLGLLGLSFINLLSTLFTILLSLIYTFKLIPEVKLNKILINTDIFKEIFHYGIKLQISRFSFFISNNIDKILITYFLDYYYVTFYELGASISRFASRFPMIFLYPITPAVSEFNIKMEKDKLTDLYLSISKYFVAFCMPIAIFAIIFAPNIISCWIGQGYEKSIIVIRILTVSYTLHIFTGIGTSIAQGIGNLRYELKYTVIMAILNITLSTALIIKFGFTGALLGTFFAMSVSSIYFILMFHKYIINYPIIKYTLNIYLIPFVFSILSYLLIYLLGFIKYTLFNFKLIEFTNTLNLLFNTFFYILFYLIFLIVIKYISIKDFMSYYVKNIFKTV